MSRLHSGVVPYSFRSIELRTIRWQVKYFYEFSVGFEPLIGLRLLMIGGIVLNQIYPVSLFVVMIQDIIKKFDVGQIVEVVFFMPVHKIAGIQGYCSKYLLSVTLSGRQYLWLTIHWCPCLMKCRGLSKGSLVLENYSRPFRFGVFFKLGYV